MTFSRTQHAAAFVAWPLHFGAIVPVLTVSRRVIGRVLLAFALLWSQQAALSHTISHLSQAGRATIGVVKKTVKPLLMDQVCAECLAHAQFFSLLDGGHRSSALAKSPSLRIVVLATPSDCILTVFVFQPRAPPLP